MSGNNMEIATGTDWDLRLWRNGLFSLRLNICTEEGPDGVTATGANCLTAPTPAELGQHVVRYARRADVLELVDALRSAEAHLSEALDRRRAYLAKLASARRAVQAQRASRDVSAELEELRQMERSAQGGAA